jgi:hypothetical protein
MDISLSVTLQQQIQETLCWKCSLLFPDASNKSRDDNDIDLSRLMVFDPSDVLQMEFLQYAHEQCFPPHTAFWFDITKYGDEMSSLNYLRKDLFDAAKKAGFDLSTQSNGGCSTKGILCRVVFVCTHYLKYRAESESLPTNTARTTILTDNIRLHGEVFSKQKNYNNDDNVQSSKVP